VTRDLRTVLCHSGGIAMPKRSWMVGAIAGLAAVVVALIVALVMAVAAMTSLL
jgi:hypothetical protein